MRGVVHGIQEAKLGRHDGRYVLAVVAKLAWQMAAINACRGNQLARSACSRPDSVKEALIKSRMRDWSAFVSGRCSLSVALATV